MNNTKLKFTICNYCKLVINFKIRKLKMKNLKSILITAILALLFITGCENSLTSSGEKNYPAIENEILSDDLTPKLYNKVIKLLPGESATFTSENLPMNVFNSFKIKNVSSDAESNICSEVLYSFAIAGGFFGSELECMRAGQEISVAENGFYFLSVTNNSKSVMKFEITVSE